MSTIDTNIKIPAYNPFSGDMLLVTEMDPNVHLWGLFFDRSYYTIMNPSGATTTTLTYFLYDFDNHQKHYLDVQPFTQPFFNYGPVDGSLNNINFLNDTIYITMGMSDFLVPSSKQIIIRWSIGKQISIGEIGAMAPKVVYSSTLNNGIYNLYVANGVQTVTTSNTSPFFTPVPSSYNFNFITQTDTSGINFALQHTGPAVNDLRIDLTAGIHRIFQTNWYSLTYKNTGSAAASGTVTVQFDPCYLSRIHFYHQQLVGLAS